MNDETPTIDLQGNLHTPQSQSPQGSLAPVVGVVTQQIGSGEHAQNDLAPEKRIPC